MSIETAAPDNALLIATELFFQRNLAPVTEAFQQHAISRVGFFRHSRRDLVARINDPGTNWSEKPLCNVIEQIPLPEGFVPVGNRSGRLEICPPMLNADKLPAGMHEQMSLTIPHNFAADAKGNVLCITPGQWQEYDPFRDAQGRGSKIAILQKMAPDLVINFPEAGVGFVVGPRRLLLMQFGLIYSW
jgi:hypothetical protein